MSNRSRNYNHRRKSRKQPQERLILVREKPDKDKSYQLLAKAIVALLVIALGVYIYVNRGAMWQALSPTVRNLGNLGILWGGLGAIFGTVLNAPKLQGYGIALLILGGVLATIA